MLGPADMDYILDHAEVGFALIDDNLLCAARPARGAAEARHRSDRDRSRPGRPRRAGLESFNDLIKGQSEIEPDIEIDDRDLAMIIYTSGTTSRPKGAMHCHLAVVMAVMSNCIEMQLSRDDGITGQFPLFHCAGHVLLLSYLSVGGRMALMRGFDPVVCMEAIVRDKLTVFVGLSLMYQAILDHPRRREFDLSGLRCLHLHHGADGPAAAGARDGRSLPELRALQRPDRNVSGHHDVAAGGQLNASATTGANR